MSCATARDATNPASTRIPSRSRADLASRQLGRSHNCLGFERRHLDGIANGFMIDVHELRHDRLHQMAQLVLSNVLASALHERVHKNAVTRLEGAVFGPKDFWMRRRARVTGAKEELFVQLFTRPHTGEANIDVRVKFEARQTN